MAFLLNDMRIQQATAAAKRDQMAAVRVQCPVPCVKFPQIILEIRKEGDHRIPIWIIIGSTLGGLLLLALLILALWKVSLTPLEGYAGAAHYRRYYSLLCHAGAWVFAFFTVCCDVEFICSSCGLLRPLCSSTIARTLDSALCRALCFHLGSPTA